MEEIILTIEQIIAKNLKEARKSQSKTQNEVANFLKIDRSTYAYYESGKVSPSIEKLLKLAKFLEVDINFLIK